MVSQKDSTKAAASKLRPLLTLVDGVVTAKENCSGN